MLKFYREMNSEGPPGKLKKLFLFDQRVSDQVKEEAYHFPTPAWLRTEQTDKQDAPWVNKPAWKLLNAMPFGPWVITVPRLLLAAEDSKLIEVTTQKLEWEEVTFKVGPFDLERIRYGIKCDFLLVDERGKRAHRGDSIRGGDIVRVILNHGILFDSFPGLCKAAPTMPIWGSE